MTAQRKFGIHKDRPGAWVLVYPDGDGDCFDTWAEAVVQFEKAVTWKEWLDGGELDQIGA